MTSLFRQGVEFVCKGKRKADRVQGPLAEGSPGGAGDWETGRARAGAGGRGVKGKSSHRTVGFSELVARQPLLCTRTPSCPQANSIGAHFSGPCFRLDFSERDPLSWRAPVKAHLELSLVLPPGLRRIVLGCSDGTRFVSVSQPHAIKRPFLLLG